MRQITWGGMTEVSNNIFSMYTVAGMGNQSRLKAQKNYASARKNIVEAHPKKSLLDGTDVFDRLVPFWQLHLYFARNGRPDFYADVMEEMRRRPDAIRQQMVEDAKSYIAKKEYEKPAEDITLIED